MTLKTRKVEAGRYDVFNAEDVVVGQVFRERSYWQGKLFRCDEPLARWGFPNMGSAVKSMERALERGGTKIIRIQPAPRIDNVIDGQELTQLPYPLHVRAFSGTVLDDWAEELVGFARDLSKQQVDLWWGDAVQGDPSSVVGMYIVIKNADGNYAMLDTAVQKVEVSL